jgi:hypothetical protein
MPFTPVRKPPPGTKVNWGHSLGTGLSICFPMNEGGGTVVTDVVGGVVGAFSGTTLPIWLPEIYGPAVHFLHGAAASSFIDCGTPPSAQDLVLLTSSGGPIGSSWFIRFLWDDSNNASGGLCERNDVNTVNAGWLIGYDNAAGQPLGAQAEFGGAANQRDTFFVPVVNTWYDLVVTRDAATTSAKWIAYLNGVQLTTTTITSGSGTSGSDATRHLYIGRESFQSPASWAGFISTVCIWKGRILTLADAQLLHKDPWAYMQPRPNPRYFFISKVSKSLTATAATKAGSLNRKTLITLAAGAHTKAGALTLTLFKTLTATAATKAGSLVAQIVPVKVLAATMLLRSATLGRNTLKTLAATKATFAGVLTAIKAGNKLTLAATAATKAGSLNRKIFIAFQTTAAKAMYQGRLTMVVTHGPPPPPTCIPAACPTIPNIVSHHAICELSGS